MRVAVVLLTALALAPPARAASIQISTSLFSPQAAGLLTIQGTVEAPAPLGVRLSSLDGEPIGWIDPPAVRDAVLLFWDGTIDGEQVHDGYYRVELVATGRVVASTGFRLDSEPARLEDLSVGNGSVPFAGDGPLLTTLTPNRDDFREYARIRFVLPEPAKVTLNVQQTGAATVGTIYTRTWKFRTGSQAIAWVPAANLRPRTYVLSLTTRDSAGNELTYGSPDPFVKRHPRAPVARLLGVDATFTRQSYAPGQIGGLRIASDEPRLELRAFRTGPEDFVTYADNLLEGEPVGAAVTIDWRRQRDAPKQIRFQIGDWPSGLYFVKLTAPDGEIGYAPFVVHPQTLGAAVSGRGRPADEQLAGLQLLRRQRRRLGRHLVRGTAAPDRRARPPVPAPRRAVVLLPLRPGLPALAVLVAADGRLPRRVGRGDGLRRQPRGRLRPDRLPGAQRVRDRRRSTTRSSASATWAET